MVTEPTVEGTKLGSKSGSASISTTGAPIEERITSTVATPSAIDWSSTPGTKPGPVAIHASVRGEMPSVPSGWSNTGPTTIVRACPGSRPPETETVRSPGLPAPSTSSLAGATTVPVFVAVRQYQTLNPGVPGPSL